MFFAKDFIETAEGLIFAVVDQGLEDGKALCFLRYALTSSGWKKVATEQANSLLHQQHPDYLHYSPILDAHLHAVAADRIVKHHQPKHRLQRLMLASRHDAVERDLFRLCELLGQHGLDLAQTGVTGSILVGLQNQSSDIDLVCYGREVFHQCRAITRKLIEQGHLQDLNDQDWRQSYRRRSCALSFDEYVWHERRKCNKAVIDGRKFDLNFIDHDAGSEAVLYQKCGAITLQCKVVDDARGFDYPAEFKIDHQQISAIVSFTATYTGQAVSGEMVEVSGVLEQSEQGVKRIVVGSSREAHGEYIKVIRCGRCVGWVSDRVTQQLSLRDVGLRLPPNPTYSTDFSAVIFDMDGLVLDTESTYSIAWQQAASAMGYDFSEDFCLSLSGLHYPDIELKLLAYCGAEFNLQTFNRLSGECWRDHVNIHGINIKYGFAGLLDLLIKQNIPYCLATNSRTVNALECLELAGIKDVFSIIISRDHVQNGKPEPDIFLKAAELMQVDISRCLVLEDSHAGIVAASRAGAVSVFIPSIAQVDPLTVELCNLMMDDLAQLTHAIGA